MEKIGPYQILKELGRGGMGVVYRGVDPVIGRHVAIKTLRPEDMGEASERGSMGEKLLREARSAGMLSHPSIVTIYQAGQDGDILYIAMEFIDGANLADVLAQGRLHNDAMLKILRQSADALDYAHSKGVVHRDIKPGNLLMEPSGKVKVADFGIAKLNQAGVTKTTSSVGSPAYMSPEHVRAQAIDGRADQYSLGVVAHEMLTGRRPHDSEELTSLVFKVVFEPPDLTSIGALPKGETLTPVFEKVLAKSADDRYGSCTEFVEALAVALGEASASASQPPSTMASVPRPPAQSIAPSTQALPQDPTQAVAPPPSSPPSSGNKGLLFGGGIVLAASLAVAGYFLTRAPQPAAPQEPPPSGKVEDSTAKPTPPVLIERADCAKPSDASVASVRGEVRVMLQVDTQGQPQRLEVPKSLHPLLDQRAKECVAKYRFQPATSNGKDPRVATIGIDVSFE